MKKQNEINKLNNAKKKLLAYATLATLGSSVLIGCQNSSSQNDEKDSTYQTTADGSISIKKSITYEKLIKLKLIKVIGFNDEEKVHLVKKDWLFNEMVLNSTANSYVYTDVLTDKEIIKTTTTTLKYEELGNISDYLVSMDMLKDKYNKDDVNKLIEYVETCEEKEVEKVKQKPVE